MLNIAELQKEMARLQGQIAALDTLITSLGGEIPIPAKRGRKAKVAKVGGGKRKPMSPAVKAKMAAAAKKRWAAAKAAGKNKL